MTIHKKSSAVQGGWVRASELTSGMLAKLTTGTEVQEGEYGKREVAKIKIKGFDEVLNVTLNKTTINGLIEAFGEDDSVWIGKVLTVHTEKSVVSGKRVTVLYLLPEGFELKEDEQGYLKVLRVGTKAVKEVSDEDLPIIEDQPREIDESSLPF